MALTAGIKNKEKIKEQICKEQFSEIVYREHCTFWIPRVRNFIKFWNSHIVAKTMTYEWPD